MVDLGAMGGMATGLITNWGTSIGFWFAIVFGVTLFGWVGLVFRKRRKLNKPVLVIYDNGDGITSYENTFGGWFKNRFTLMGLWDYGTEKRFRLKNMMPVDDVSHHDYRLINGKQGIVVVIDPHDPKFAIPISKIHFSPESKKAIAEIAPADLRDVAVKAIEEADKEMTAKWEKIMPYIAMGFVGMVLIFSILLIAQYGKHNIDKVAEIMKMAVEALKDLGNTQAVSKYTDTGGQILAP